MDLNFDCNHPTDELVDGSTVCGAEAGHQMVVVDPPEMMEIAVLDVLARGVLPWLHRTEVQHPHVRPQTSPGGGGDGPQL
mmetsp:Transcript_1465/g.8945  ORF Transcript_1465/g.8945 Transcript_1465/m.8945 type:complete len:80 (-) Transcript_1465:1612-1851(-)